MENKEQKWIRTAAGKAHKQKDHCQIDIGEHLGNTNIIVLWLDDRPRRLDTVSPVYNDAYFQLLLFFENG